MLLFLYYQSFDLCAVRVVVVARLELVLVARGNKPEETVRIGTWLCVNVYALVTFLSVLYIIHVYSDDDGY